MPYLVRPSFLLRRPPGKWMWLWFYKVQCTSILNWHILNPVDLYVENVLSQIWYFYGINKISLSTYIVIILCVLDYVIPRNPISLTELFAQFATRVVNLLLNHLLNASNDSEIMEHIKDTWLTHWGQVIHICISKLHIIGSDKGFLPGWHQANICTNAGISLIWTLWTNLNAILSEIRTFSVPKNWKCHLEDDSHIVSATVS